MSVEALLDTNVLLYAVSTDPVEAAKRERARQLMAQGGVALSAQVLGEFYVNATRSRGPAMDHRQAVAILRSLRAFPIAPLTAEVVWQALKLRERFGVSYWDGAILAAAASLGCRLVYSEDLNDGQDYGGVRVVNPF